MPNAKINVCILFLTLILVNCFGQSRFKPTITIPKQFIHIVKNSDRNFNSANHFVERATIEFDQFLINSENKELYGYEYNSFSNQWKSINSEDTPSIRIEGMLNPYNGSYIFEIKFFETDSNRGIDGFSCTFSNLEYNELKKNQLLGELKDCLHRMLIGSRLDNNIQLNNIEEAFDEFMYYSKKLKRNNSSKDFNNLLDALSKLIELKNIFEIKGKLQKHHFDLIKDIEKEMDLIHDTYVIKRIEEYELEYSDLLNQERIENNKTQTKKRNSFTKQEILEKIIDLCEQLIEKYDRLNIKSTQKESLRRILIKNLEILYNLFIQQTDHESAIKIKNKLLKYKQHKP